MNQFHATAGQVTPGNATLRALCDAQNDGWNVPATAKYLNNGGVPVSQDFGAALDKTPVVGTYAGLPVLDLSPAPLTASTFSDVETIEDGCVDDEGDGAYFMALQRQINSGLIWRLQGSAGRAAMEAIRSGHCILGRKACADYYGNQVPGRKDVQDGTKGSVGFAAKLHGKAYALTIALA